MHSDQLIVIPLTLPIVTMEGTKIIQRQRTFTYNNISFTGFKLAILVAPQELTVGNLCSHKVCRP